MPAINLEMLKNKRTLMGVTVALTAIIFILGRVSGMIATSMGVDSIFVPTITRTVLSVICMIVLGGASWLIPNVQKIRDTWFFARPLVLINLVVGILFGALGTFILLFLGEFTAAQLMQFFSITVLCIFVGINEEVLFRGILFGGLLAGMGGRRGGALWAAVISSIAFGFVHVIIDINYTDFLSITQGLLKTLETGMFGLILCVPVLEGRNLVGAMTAHAFFDWILMIQSSLTGEMPTGHYVNADARVAIAAIVVYVVFALMYTPKTIQSFKRLNALPVPQYGPFVPEGESAQIVNTVAKERQDALSQLPTGASPAHMHRVRADRVLDHKVATIFVTLLYLMVATNLVSFVALALFGSGIASQVASAVGTVIVSMLMLLGYQRMFKSEFDGMMGWSTQALLLVLPALALGIANVFDWPGATFNNPLVCLILAMSPGFSEEIVFRAIPLSNWMRVSCEKSEIYKCAAVTAAGFGIIHSVNLLAGAAFSATLFQVFYAFCLGVMFAAVMLRTGSVWPCVIMHTLIDFLSFLTTDMTKTGILTQELTIDFAFWFVVVVSIALAVWGAYLLRPAKHDEIVALWRKKWHKVQGRPVATPQAPVSEPVPTPEPSQVPESEATPIPEPLQEGEGEATI